MKKFVSILLVLLFAFSLVALSACQTGNDIENFKKKFDSANSFTAEIKVTIPENNVSQDFVFQVDGNMIYYYLKGHQNTQFGYLEISGDVVYTYQQTDDGKWYKVGSSVSDQAIWGDIDLAEIEEVYGKVLDYHYYDKIGRGIYKQKEFYSFGYLSNVQIRFTNKKCTIGCVVAVPNNPNVNLVIDLYNIDTTTVTMPETHPIDDFDAKIQVGNFVVMVTKTTGTGTKRYSISVDGDKYRIEQDGEVLYCETGYKLYLEKDGVWYKYVSYSFCFYYLPTFSIFFNVDDYEEVEGQPGVYQQKAGKQIYDSVETQEYVTNVKLTLTENGCTIEYTVGNAFYTIVISDMFTTTVELPIADQVRYY